MSKEQTTTAISSSLTTILFIVFLVLKLTGNIDWSWWWVTSPLWLPVAILFTIVSILLIAGIIMLYSRENKYIETKTEIKMKQTITYSVFFLTVLIATVGLITTINEYPDFAYVIGFILLTLLGGMGVKKFLDDRRIK